MVDQVSLLLDFAWLCLVDEVQVRSVDFVWTEQLTRRQSVYDCVWGQGGRVAAAKEGLPFEGGNLTWE